MKIVLTIENLKIMEMNYVAPELEVLEVMVETGFAGSGIGAGSDTTMPNPGAGTDI